MRPCQLCGRPAKFVQKNAAKYKGIKKRRKSISRNDHDLCRKCWHSLMESIRAEALPE